MRALYNFFPFSVSAQLIVPQLEPLTDQQITRINKLRLSSQQAEDALSQGLDKLQQSLVQDMTVDPLGAENFGIQMAVAIEKFEALEGFVNQVMLCNVTPDIFSILIIALFNYIVNNCYHK